MDHSKQLKRSPSRGFRIGTFVVPHLACTLPAVFLVLFAPIIVAFIHG